MGCGICRSENMELIETNENAASMVNLEKRKDMQKRFGQVHGHDLRREMGQFEEYYQELEESPEERAARIARERKAAQERAKKQQQKIEADNRRVAAAAERLSRPARKCNADP